MTTENTHPTLVPDYLVTDAEAAALKRHQARREEALPAPRLKVAKRCGVMGGDGEVSIDHPDRRFAKALLSDALGTADPDFLEGVVTQLIEASLLPDGARDEKRLNFLLSVIKGVKPRDPLEALLALQMAAVHEATMDEAHRLATTFRDIAERESAVAALNKFARTFTDQLEALKRYRSGGAQTVTVQHVHVGDGGQAIVGPVTRAPAAAKAAAPAAPALAHSAEEPMARVAASSATAPVEVRRRRGGGG